MRLTDDRYAQERHRMEVALRMIRLEARTCTIRACTGLSEDRVRKLFNAYIEPHCFGSVRRRRGKSPQQAACFTQTAGAQLSASVLAGVFATCELLDERVYRNASPFQLGALMCDLYEFYRVLDPGAWSFEHAWFLLRNLHEGQELAIAQCVKCGALHVRDRWMIRSESCPFCRNDRPKNRSAKQSNFAIPRESGAVHIAA